MIIPVSRHIFIDILWPSLALRWRTSRESFSTFKLLRVRSVSLLLMLPVNEVSLSPIILPYPKCTENYKDKVLRSSASPAISSAAKNPGQKTKCSNSSKASSMSNSQCSLRLRWMAKELTKSTNISRTITSLRKVTHQSAGTEPPMTFLGTSPSLC